MYGWVRGVVPRVWKGGTAGWCAAGAVKLMTGWLCGKPTSPVPVESQLDRFFFFFFFPFQKDGKHD